MEGKNVLEVKAAISSEIPAENRNTDLFLSPGSISQGLPGEIGVSGKTGPPGPPVSAEELFP